MSRLRVSKRILALASLFCALPLFGTTSADQAMWLSTQNAERAKSGSIPLVWSVNLANDAAKWARHLAITNSFEHSDASGQGENLWMGTPGYSAEEMVGSWIAEKRHFKYGRFPAVSSTGSWADVGHYTQVIWPGTKAVGCASAKGDGYIYLVCRYSPAGNVIGEYVGNSRARVKSRMRRKTEGSRVSIPTP
jgi:hypothetical protein